MAILNPKLVQLSIAEQESYKSYKKQLKEIQAELKTLGFQDGIKKAHNFTECLTFILSDPQLEVKLQTLLDLIEKNQSLISKEQEQSVSKEIEKQIPFLKRNNWVIIRGKNLNEIHSLIKQNRPASVMMLSHSSPEGKLFDEASNVFPQGYFQSLIGIVDNLIMFSCYPLEVIKNYQLEKSGEKINYFYPVPRGSAGPILGDKTPIVALKSIKNITLNGIEKDPNA